MLYLQPVAFGEALKEVRAELGWTQPELADAIREASGGAIRLTPAEISRYERGKVASPRLDLIRAVAQATNKPSGYFTDEEADPSPFPADQPPRSPRRPDRGSDGGAGQTTGNGRVAA